VQKVLKSGADSIRISLQWVSVDKAAASTCIFYNESAPRNGCSRLDAPASVLCREEIHLGQLQHTKWPAA